MSIAPVGCKKAKGHAAAITANLFLIAAYVLKKCDIVNIVEQTDKFATDFASKSHFLMKTGQKAQILTINSLYVSYIITQIR